jgi:hypothetical protein
METTTNNAVTCHWLIRTRIMPEPYRVEALTRPWTCLRDGYPRPLDARELCDCAACVRREPRTFETAKRDLVIEAWGGAEVCAKEPAYDEARRIEVLRTWGVE